MSIFNLLKMIDLNGYLFQKNGYLIVDLILTDKA